MQDGNLNSGQGVALSICKHRVAAVLFNIIISIPLEKLSHFRRSIAEELVIRFSYPS